MDGGTAIDLSPERRGRLNSILDGCFWNACFIDEQARMGIVIVELVGVLFEGQRMGDAYPVVMICYPVCRVAASYKVDGSLRALDLRDINTALHDFSFKEIDDWDIIDPPASQRFRWRKDLSLDVNLGECADTHILEMWQDDGSFQTFNLAIWFQKLFLFDAHLNPLTLDDLERARRKRREVNSDLGWRRIATVPAFSIEDLLHKIRCE